MFNLIRIGQMRKTKDDSREDFDNVFDFDAGLRQSFKITLPESTPYAGIRWPPNRNDLIPRQAERPIRLPPGLRIRPTRRARTAGC